MADKLFAVHNHRMTGIVSALKSYNHIGNFREHIHNLALAFISPLCSDNYNI